MQQAQDFVGIKFTLRPDTRREVIRRVVREAFANAEAIRRTVLTGFLGVVGIVATLLWLTGVI